MRTVHVKVTETIEYDWRCPDCGKLNNSEFSERSRIRFRELECHSCKAKFHPGDRVMEVK